MIGNESTRLRESGFEQAFNPATVDIERFEDIQDFFHIQVFVDGPGQDVEVFLAPLEATQDLLHQRGILIRSREEAEIVVVELDPEGAAWEVFEPFLAEEAVPVLADPAADRPFAEVA